MTAIKKHKPQAAIQPKDLCTDEEKAIKGHAGEVISFPPAGSAAAGDYPKWGSPQSSVITSPTEDDVAEEFAVTHQGIMAFCPEASSWYFFDGKVWRQDNNKAFHTVRMISRARRGSARALSTNSSVEGALRMAQKDPRMVRHAADWDFDPSVLGTPDGPVDLRTGHSLSPESHYFITKQTLVAPAAHGTDSPAFDKFLHEITNGDLSTQEFLTAFGGYCLTGETKEQVLLFLYGPGGNGKTVFQNVLSEILGDYAKPAVPELFAASRQQRHLSELAVLKGARLVTAAETDQGHSWHEAKIKLLTGGEKITANLMRQDPISFAPEFKLLFTGNHKPQLRSASEAMRRRFMLLDFDFKPATPDHELPQKLRNEYPAILRKLVNGSVEWYKNGLIQPTSVKAATAEYFEEEDIFAQWLAENCVKDSAAHTKSNILYNDWNSYCLERGEEPGSNKALSQRLKAASFEKKTSGCVFYLGLKLKLNAAFK